MDHVGCLSLGRHLVKVEKGPFPDGHRQRISEFGSICLMLLKVSHKITVKLTRRGSPEGLVPAAALSFIFEPCKTSKFLDKTKYAFMILVAAEIMCTALENVDVPDQRVRTSKIRTDRGSLGLIDSLKHQNG